MSLAPDLRAPVFAVAGRYADEATWNKLHERGVKTTSIEEKQNYYDALAGALDPKLANRTLEISLGDEVPTSRAIHLVAKVARQSERPDVAWQFAKTHMKQLLAKADALAASLLCYEASYRTLAQQHPGRYVATVRAPRPDDQADQDASIAHVV